MEDNSDNALKKMSGEEIKVFDAIVRALNIALESSALYNPNHPAVVEAVKNFKAHLDSWFLSHEFLDIGISSDNLLLQNKFVREKHDLFKQVANYLHSRGIVALRISRGVELKELLIFLSLIVKDAALIKQEGGILSQVPLDGHILIKEIDYRNFLAGGESQGQGITQEERNIWQELTSLDLSDGLKALPESKLDFVTNFLKDQKKSASLLNKVYKEALAKLEDGAVVDSFRATFKRMLKYAQEQPFGNACAIKKDLAKVISGLNPDFVANLFTAQPANGLALDSGQDLLKDLPEDAVADFMASLIDSEGKMSDSLFKLFDKLVPQETSSGSLISTLADKLFAKKLLNKNTLSQLQVSIKELFEANSGNQFISEMYKLTVETLIDKSVSGKDKNRLSALAQDCLASLEETSLQKEKIRLLLNILWQENKPEEFKKFSQMLVAACKRIIQPEYLLNIKESVEFFAAKLKPGEYPNQEISGAASLALLELTDKTILTKIISFLPKLSEKEIPDLSSILKKSEIASELILEAYISEKNKSEKQKIALVIAGLGEKAAESISRRIVADLGKEDPSLPELFNILKELSPQEARKAAREMLQSKESEMRLRGLESFNPETQEDNDLLFEVFKTVTDAQIKEKIIYALAKTNSAPIIEKMFDIFTKSFSAPKYQLICIKACGDFLADKAVPSLGKVLAKKPFLDNQRKRELRIAAVVSLGEIASLEALEALGKALNDKSESVRKIARLAIESCKDKAGVK